MPEGKAVKQLPPELPKEYREFVACTRQELVVPHGEVGWATIPGLPGLKPSTTFENLPGGKVRITVSAAGLSLQTTLSVSKRGSLAADTSSWPVDTPLIGDSLKQFADGLGKWVDDLNADFRRNDKKIGSISADKDGNLTAVKVPLATKTAMAETGKSGPRGGRLLWLAGTGAGILLAGLSAVALVGGGGESPADPVFPLIGEPVTVAGTLATSELDFEVTADVSSDLDFAFPASGGLVDGSAQVVYEAVTATGTAFTNTSDLDPWAVFEADGHFYGYARHLATAVANEQTQTRELAPMELAITVDPVTGAVGGAFVGDGFSYPVSGQASGAITPTAAVVSRDGTTDPSAHERADAALSVTDNTWRLYLNDGNRLTGAGVLAFTQSFTSDAFGAGCAFEGVRVFTVDATFDAATGAVSGPAGVLAWGTPSETCTFETGTAFAESTIFGTFDVGTGDLQAEILGDEVVNGPYPIEASWDTAQYTPTTDGGSAPALRLLGLAVGILLAGASLVGIRRGMSDQATV